MSDLRIIYVPEARNLLLDKMLTNPNFLFINPIQKEMRSDYNQIKSMVEDLPQNVGILTFNDLTKGSLK